ncbi:hypothetical protein D3C87_795860 [compost metagenome]
MEGAPRTARIAELLTYNRGEGDGVEYISMEEGEDILYRPVMAGKLDVRALTDGSVSLGQIMRLNEAIDVENENQYRATKAAEARAKRVPPGARR